MPRVSLLLASLGLALNVLLWSVPGLVTASAAVQLLLPIEPPNLLERLAQPAHRQAAPSLQDALVGLMGAEVEAMQVAGIAIENPRASRLAERADAAGNRVREAVLTYIRAFERITNHPLPRL
jgi:hypothetical protein